MAKRKKIDYNLAKEVTEGAFLNEQEIVEQERQFIEEIAVDHIKANPYQPRLNIDGETLDELASSIKQNGLMQPITVVKQDDGTYTVLYGHRRVAAHVKLGLSTIKAIVLPEVVHAQLALLPIIENLQRDDMNAIETAMSMKRILDEHIVKTQNALAEHLGLSKSWTSKILSLMKLPSDLIVEIRNENYNDITVLSALNKLEKDHTHVFEVIKNLDRKAALHYIKERISAKNIVVEERVNVQKNKIMINTKGLSATKKNEVEQLMEQVRKLLGED
jgi:ParB family chromosome partitioning protein